MRGARLEIAADQLDSVPMLVAKIDEEIEALGRLQAEGEELALVLARAGKRAQRAELRPPVRGGRVRREMHRRLPRDVRCAGALCQTRFQAECLGLIWDSRCPTSKQKPPISGGFRSG
jgi:hypothetical protein